MHGFAVVFANHVRPVHEEVQSPPEAVRRRDVVVQRPPVQDVVLYPRIAPVPSDWEELNFRRDALSKIEIEILKPEERWLHPWDSAWYLCLADIGSQYYILQRCDEKGELVLLDYINDELVQSGGNSYSLITYAYSHGHWIEDKNALRRFVENDLLHV